MFCSRCGTEVNKAAKFCPSCGLDLTAATTGGGAAATETAPAEQSEFDVVREALKDEYELVKELGRGGMAIVFKARDKQLDREVAIKVLPFSLSYDKDFVERFQREARTSAKLEHPNIIPIYRVGRADKVIYFVMKFLRGTSLSEAIEKKGAMAPADIRKMLAETARALHYAHQHGIVHRDIKPDNIMFDELGHAIVTDFGIAKAASGTKLTGTGMSIGTPHYMSPEQARAQPLDGRSDIYSLGVVAYQCLAGHVPFDGEDSFSIGYKHIMEVLPVPPLKSHEERDLYEVIKRMMAKSADDRFQNAEALASVLEGRVPMAAVPTASAPTVAVRAAPTTMAPAAGAATPTTPTTPIPRAEPKAPPRPPKKKRSGALVGMLFLLLAGGGAGGWYYYTNYMEAGRFRLARGTAPPANTDSTPPRGSAAAADSTPASDTAGKPPEPAAPVATTGTLEFRGLPAGARVRIDGQMMDPSQPISVEPGSHRIEALAAGYETYATNQNVAKGEKIVLPIPLKRLAPARGQPLARREPVRQPEPSRPQPQPSQPQPAQPRPAQPAAASQCDTYGPTYNADGSCFDTRPVALEAPLIPIPEGVEGTPSRSFLVVQVSSAGKALTVRFTQPSNNAQFHIAAMNFARSVEYKPAEKNGKPVTAWVPLVVLPRSR